MRATLVAVLALILVTSGLVNITGEARADWGGVDEWGHRWFDSDSPPPQTEYKWIEINGTNDTGIPTSWMGDDSSRKLDLNFSVEFYGVDYTSIHVSSNGFIDFGDPNDEHIEWTNQNIPSNTSWNDVSEKAVECLSLDGIDVKAIDFRNKSYNSCSYNFRLHAKFSLYNFN